MFFPSELAYSRSQCSLYLITWKPAHLVRTLNLANSDSITPGFFLSLSPLALLANQGFWSNSDWIEEDIHLSSQGEWLPDRCHWAHLVCKPSFLGSFPHWFRCPATGPLPFGSAHLPYQAAAPNLASCLLLDSSHRSSPCWNPHPTPGFVRGQGLKGHGVSSHLWFRILGKFMRKAQAFFKMLPF